METLAGTLLALLLAAAALYACARVFAGYPRPEARYRVLAAREAGFLDAAAEAVFPAGGAVSPSGRDAGVTPYVDGYLAALPPRQRRLVRGLLFLMEQATLAYPAPGPRGRRRFSALAPAQQIAALERWQRSRSSLRRLAFLSLRSLLTMAYVASPRVLRELRLAPFEIRTPVLEADLLFPPVGEPPERVRFRAADLGTPGGPPLAPDAPVDPGYRGEP